MKQMHLKMVQTHNAKSRVHQSQVCYAQPILLPLKQQNCMNCNLLNYVMDFWSTSVDHTQVWKPLFYSLWSDTVDKVAGWSVAKSLVLQKPDLLQNVSVLSYFHNPEVWYHNHFDTKCNSFYLANIEKGRFPSRENFQYFHNYLHISLLLWW